ncbi:hypothetical protein C7B69_09945 [filamentous cyanobacterium Phorm 46]|nr:hypothetical protein C7B69_09945 [filamentous cyanobacterium Phorm 46]PSB46141.1 hypothetical protein C7B67_20665 [filamentous cyanobacterium Phorm 6]
MEAEEIQAKIRQNLYIYTAHGDIERQVEEALLKGEILEQYPNTGRGESCLVLGYAGEIAIHIVCGWRGEKIAIITVYIPSSPNFINPRTRG